MGKIPIIDGDIFQSGADVIVHQVNCQGVMRSGVAKQVREKYPVVYQEYLRLCDKYKSTNNEKGLLGKAQIVKTVVPGVTYIANLFAQENFGYDGKCYTDYEALRECLICISKQFKHAKIAIPYLMACHRGGGDWDKVSQMIEETLNGCDVTFYKYTAG